MSCPACIYCHQHDAVIKSGRNATGTQRYRCRACRRYFTTDPMPNGYPADLHERAYQLFLDGTSMREIGRILDVNHQTIANWLAAEDAKRSVAQAAQAESDESYELWSIDEWRKRWR